MVRRCLLLQFIIFMIVQAGGLEGAEPTPLDNTPKDCALSFAKAVAGEDTAGARALVFKTTNINAALADATVDLLIADHRLWRLVASQLGKEGADRVAKQQGVSSALAMLVVGLDQAKIEQDSDAATISIPGDPLKTGDPNRHERLLFRQSDTAWRLDLLRMQQGGTTDAEIEANTIACQKRVRVMTVVANELEIGRITSIADLDRKTAEEIRKP